jgi:molybdopterin synthase catalytic subunit
MLIRVQDVPFDPWKEVDAYISEIYDISGKYGGVAVFVGHMRDFNQGSDVAEMTLEHYPGMTERHLEKIAREAMNRWPLLDVLVIHRVGRIRPNEPIVLVAAWSAHRDDAFSGARFLIDELKTRAPFWKKEQLGSGERWVEQE